MSWNLEGKVIDALYCGVIPVRGEVTLSRVCYGNYVKHYIKLDKPTDIYGDIREQVVVKDGDVVTI